MNRKWVPSYSIFLPKRILWVLSFAAKIQCPKVDSPEVLWCVRSSYWISFLTNLWLESSLHFSHFHICNLCPIYALGPIFKLFMLIWGVIVSVFWHWIVVVVVGFFFLNLFVWFFCFCVFNCKIGISSIVDIVTLLLNNHHKYCTQLRLYIRNKMPFHRHQWYLFSN